MAGFTYFLSYIAIETGPDIPVSHLTESFAIKCAERTGNNVVYTHFAGDDTPDHNSFEIFESLEGSAYSFLRITDFDASTDSLNSFVDIERDNNFFDGVAVERRIGIEVDDIFTPCEVSAQIGGTCLTATFLHTEVFVDVPIAFEVATYKRGRVVGAVIDDDDFIVFISLLPERHYESVDMFTLIFTRDENRDERIFGKQDHSRLFVEEPTLRLEDCISNREENFEKIISREFDKEKEPIDREQSVHIDISGEADLNIVI